MNRNYPTATKLGLTSEALYRWREPRNTDEAVALAIHAIAGGERTPDAIWENPTPAEADHVEMAVSDYVAHGDYEAGEFGWGEYRFTVANA